MPPSIQQRQVNAPGIARLGHLMSLRDVWGRPMTSGPGVVYGYARRFDTRTLTIPMPLNPFLYKPTPRLFTALCAVLTNDVEMFTVTQLATLKDALPAFFQQDYLEFSRLAMDEGQYEKPSIRYR